MVKAVATKVLRNVPSDTQFEPDKEAQYVGDYKCDSI